jgi:uncharacterized protein
MAFRVLSLDGGGVWSLMQTSALVQMYGPATTGRRVLEDFDLVAATSAGSIVLGALVEDLPLGLCQQIFADPTTRKKMFPPTKEFFGPLIHAVTGFFLRSAGISSGIGPLYDTSAKQSALEALMPTYGRLPLSRAAAGVRRSGSGRDVHLLITAFDYDRNRARFFRSAPASGQGWGQGDSSEVTLVQAVDASSDPPINYFDQPVSLGEDRFWDGAIGGYNNPVLAATVEAKVLTNASENIIALSIGTGSVALAGPPVDGPAGPYVQRKTDQSLVADIGKIAVAIVDDPPDAATFMAHVMTGGNIGLPAPLQSRIVRMSPLVRPVKTRGGWAAPGKMTDAAFKYLCGLGIDAIADEQVAAIARYANLWLGGEAPNQPIRMNGDSLECELGHEWFEDALAAWGQLCTLA